MTILASTRAHAIEPRDATYYCAAEAAGGIAYDEQLKRWRSANFRPDKKFVLKLKFLSSAKEKMFEWTGPEIVNRFSITVTAAGSNTDTPCRNIQDRGAPVDVWGNNDWLRCEASLTEYRFNPANNRFLAAYLIGYLSGLEGNDDTPSIWVGVCTKID